MFETKSRITLFIFVSAFAIPSVTQLGDVCHAQSTVIQATGEANGASSAVPFTESAIPLTLTPAQQDMWELLNSKSSASLAGVQTVADLVASLRHLGLPVVLDRTALDDEVFPKAPVRVTTLGRTLFDNLTATLDQHNATIAIPGDVILIISKDVANEPEYFSRFQYDVTVLGLSAYQLANTITSQIATDDWDVTAGDGTLSFIKLGNRKILLVSQRLEVQHQLHSMLKGLQASKGNAESVNIVGLRVGSSVVRFDRRYSQTMRRRLRNQSGGGRRGGGVGGYGLGGGIF